MCPRVPAGEVNLTMDDTGLESHAKALELDNIAKAMVP